MSKTEQITQQERELLSAVLDGEAEHRLMLAVSRRIGSDAALCHTLVRYRMIGESLRGEPVMPDGERLVAEVSRRLAEEPTVLAPASRRRGVRRWLQPAAGVAIAASVAAVGIWVAPRLLDSNRLPGAAGLAADTPVLPVVAPPPAQMAQAAPAAISRPLRWKTVDGRVEPRQERLDRYLRQHGQYATESGLQGMIPYTTLVGYGSSISVEGE